MNHLINPVEVAAIRMAQTDWATVPIRQRLQVIAAARRRLATDCEVVAAAASRPNMSVTDILLAEVMPLLAGCRFLEEQADHILAARRPAGNRPVWLAGTKLLVRRVPFGVILILAPRNYPLLLPAIQVLHALTAGNGVMVKPAPGCAEPMRVLADVLVQSGLPRNLLVVLPDSDAAGVQALRAGADKIVLTGSGQTGRQLLAQLAETITPAVLELSGDDAMIVLPGAPIETVARAICYGLTLNGGQTCIAPRRILAVGAVRAALADRLAALLPDCPPLSVTSDCSAQTTTMLEAFQGRVLGDATGVDQLVMRPLVLEVNDGHTRVPPSFGPIGSLFGVPDINTAIAVANGSPHLLGASVFGPLSEAQAVANRLRAGCVVVNDVIMPTADPRLPFGGAGDSGFGVTRGAEGLLEMTRPQAVISRRRPISLLYRPLPASARQWVAGSLRFIYG
jgi:acyl-CoA reductase-like NAD-dependent aldehyde dehydrogenase